MTLKQALTLQLKKIQQDIIDFSTYKKEKDIDDFLVYLSNRIKNVQEDVERFINE